MLGYYFSEKEFQCPCCRGLSFRPNLILRLDALRSMLGAPITINSGFRCSKHNAEIGGSPKSQHLSGNAADISAKNFPLLKELVLNNPGLFSGIGVGVNFIHVDCRNIPAKWEYDERGKVK